MTVNYEESAVKMKEKLVFRKSSGLRGTVKIPGDKSVSHRAIMFGSIAEGTTLVSNFLESGDCLSTMNCFKAMGVKIKRNGKKVRIREITPTGMLMRKIHRQLK